MKHSFRNDYGEGGHPAILNALMETNLEQQEIGRASCRERV